MNKNQNHPNPDLLYIVLLAIMHVLGRNVFHYSKLFCLNSFTFLHIINFGCFLRKFIIMDSLSNNCCHILYDSDNGEWPRIIGVYPSFNQTQENIFSLNNSQLSLSYIHSCSDILHTCTLCSNARHDALHFQKKIVSPRWAQ